MTSSNNIREVLEIKETFSILQAKKIENIISSEGKPKPRINMITKELSKKQIIVPMSNDNKANFIEDSNIYIVNINRALKNIKSEVMANFVHSDQAGIIIVTNKVVVLLDLQTIEKYVKKHKLH